MPASLDRLQFAPPPPPGMLRALSVAVVAHVLLMLALGWGVNWKRDPVLLAVEAELWSALPQEAAPKLVEPIAVPPPPIPIPVPVPPPVVNVEPPKPEPMPREADIALEREKHKRAEERRKQLAEAREARREAEKRKLLEAKRELQERRKQELAMQEQARVAQERQKLAAARQQKTDEKRIEAQRQANLDRIKGMAGATGSPASTGTALRASGPSEAYGGRVAARVKPNIVFNEDVTGNPRAEVEVRTAPDGTILGQRIVKSSGVRGWDEAVLKAVIKTGALPRDVDGRVPPSLIIGFRPKD